MEFELAYDLDIEMNREVVFVQSADRHRKVRLHVTELSQEADVLHVTGHSLGSSVRDIKAAKRDEPPVVVKAELTLVDGTWKGSLVNA